MNLRPIFYVNGILLLILATAMLVPVMVDLSMDNPDWRVFAGAQIITAFAGFLMISSTRQKELRIRLRETILLCTSAWVFLTVFSAVPLWLSELNLSYTHAFFESMSAITTTGSTILTGLDDAPQGILIWRALLQWLGGLGFLVTALSILPSLQIGGMQIFKTQSFDFEKAMPGTNQVLFYICMIYFILTLLAAFSLNAAGMTGFEALCHAMTGISTGGFSTRDASIAYFNSPMIETILMICGVLGALPFVLYLRMARGDAGAILKDSQARLFLMMIVFFTILFASYLAVTSALSPLEAFRHSAFKTVTLLTTTGFTTTGDALWGPFAVGLAFLAAFLGGCAGSTSGGLKIFRLQILWSMFILQIRKIITPNGIFQAYYAGKPVDGSIQSAIGAFFFAYVATFVMTNALLMFFGLDFSMSFASSTSALGNIGPTLSGTIIQEHNFLSLLPPPALWVLSAAMLLGRLEFFLLLVMLAPGFWKR